jgi:hypothetical protein
MSAYEDKVREIMADERAAAMSEMETVKTEDLPAFVVDRIVRDLCDRSGLGNCWDGIDPLTQSEIRETWAEMVGDALAAVQRDGP